MEDTCLKAALSYADRGWRVFPVHAAGKSSDGRTVCTCSAKDKCLFAGKHPATIRGLHDATTSKKEIKRMWFIPILGPAVACGPGPAGSSIAVVDVDPRHNGPATLDEIIKRVGPIPPCPVSLTGGGGFHFFFSWPEGVDVLPSKLGEGVDLRGRGMYVVLPPAYHHSGSRYAWAEGMDLDTPLGDPSWLLRALEGQLQDPKEETEGPVLDPSDPGARYYALSALTDACHAIKYAKPGSRHETLNREAYSLGGLVSAGLLLREEVERGLMGAAPTEGDGTKQEDFTEHEARKTIAKGLADGMARPRGKNGSQSKSASTFTNHTSLSTAQTQDISRSSPGAWTDLDVEEVLDSLHRAGPGCDWSELGLARRQLQVLDDLLGQALISCGGAMWYYDQSRGVWRTLPSRLLRAHLRWHGTVDKDGDALKISLLKSKAVQELMLLEREDEEFLDGRGRGIALQDGTLIPVQQESGTEWRLELVPHSPDLRVTRWLNVRWEEGETNSRMLSAFLSRILPDEDSRLLVQQFAGAALLGVAPEARRALVLYGPSSMNGKSELAALVAGLFPPEAVRSIPPHILDHEYYRAQLVGCSINVVGEMPSAEIVASEAFKAIVTGDRISGRNPCGRPVFFESRAAHILACNELPQVGDHSQGFWRRVAVVPMDQVIRPDEEIPRIAQLILQHEKPAVARWAAEGAKSLLENRLQYRIGQAAKEAASSWEAEANQLRAFLDSETEVRDGEWTGAEDLYGRYRSWSERTGHGRMSLTRLASRLQGLGILKKRAATGSLWGLKLRERV